MSNFDFQSSIRYMMEPPVPRYFTINEATGNITVAKELNTSLETTFQVSLYHLTLPVVQELSKMIGNLFHIFYQTNVSVLAILDSTGAWCPFIFFIAGIFKLIILHAKIQEKIHKDPPPTKKQIKKLLFCFSGPPLQSNFIAISKGE